MASKQPRFRDESHRLPSVGRSKSEPFEIKMPREPQRGRWLRNAASIVSERASYDLSPAIFAKSNVESRSRRRMFVLGNHRPVRTESKRCMEQRLQRRRRVRYRLLELGNTANAALTPNVAVVKLGESSLSQPAITAEGQSQDRNSADAMRRAKRIAIGVTESAEATAYVRTGIGLVAGRWTRRKSQCPDVG